jgi:hypothetical protein
MVTTVPSYIINPSNKGPGITNYSPTGQVLSYTLPNGKPGPVSGVFTAGTRSNTFNPYGNLLTTPLPIGGPTPTGSTTGTGLGSYSLTPNSSTTSTNPNDQFTLLNQAKNPAIASSAANTLDTENNLASTESKNFNQYLTEAQQALGSDTSDVATDTKNLQALPAKTATSLNNTNAQYATAANDANTNYQNLNTENAATVAGDVAQLGDLDQQYVTNSQAALNLGLAQAGGAINARSINPAGSSGSSSDYNQAVLTSEAQANLGLQQNLSNMQINQLTGYVTPLQQQLYSGNVAQTQYGAQLAQTIAGMQTGSAEQIAALTQAVAGRPASEQQSLLSSLGLPLQVQQQVMSSLPQSLQSLTGIDQSNNFYGLAGNNANGTVSDGTNYTTPISSGGAYSAPNVQSGPQRMGAVAPTVPTVAPYQNNNPGVTAASGVPPSGDPNPSNNNTGYVYNSPQYWQAIASGKNLTGYSYDPITGLTTLNSDTGNAGAYANPAGGSDDED